MGVFEANHHKCLDINGLGQKPGFSNRAQSCLIVLFFRLANPSVQYMTISLMYPSFAAQIRPQL
jgi:hypothetical protein